MILLVLVFQSNAVFAWVIPIARVCACACACVGSVNQSLEAQDPVTTESKLTQLTQCSSHEQVMIRFGFISVTKWHELFEPIFYFILFVILIVPPIPNNTVYYSKRKINIAWRYAILIITTLKLIYKVYWKGEKSQRGTSK